MSAATEVRVPDIGDFTDVPVIEIHVAAGDEVAAEDPLVTLESDKATMDVPAPSAGTIKQLQRQDRRPGLRGQRAADARGRRRGTGGRGACTGAKRPRRTDAAPARRGSRRAQPPPVPAPAAGDHDAQVVVIGSGPGGYTAAFRAADLGLKTVLVERYETLGGVCLNVGCIPSKALLHAARVVAEAEEMARARDQVRPAPGRPGGAAGWKQSVVGKLTGGLAALARQRKVEVDHGDGAVHRTEHASTVGDRTITFDNCIIAAGSQAASLPGLPDDPRIVDSTGALSPDEFPSGCWSIGGGIIGLEMATVYDALGSHGDRRRAARPADPGLRSRPRQAAAASGSPSATRRSSSGPGSSRSRRRRAG